MADEQMRIEIARLSGKLIASVGSWEAAEAVARLLGDNVKVADNLVWTGLTFMLQPTRNYILIDLTA